MKKFLTISELSKDLELIDRATKKPLNHILRYWEKEFKQIKPKILSGNRRYYDIETINILKKIKFLLKDQGMTIKGVKQILRNNEPLKLDEMANKSIKANNLKNKLVKISNIVKKLKSLK